MFLTNAGALEGKGKIKTSALFAIEVLCCCCCLSTKCPVTPTVTGDDGFIVVVDH